MKSFVSALVALVLIGAASWSILTRNFQETSGEKFATSSTRVTSEH